RRLPSEYENMVYSIFPNGYQPNTESKIYDGTFALGYKWKSNEWNFDLSNMFGDNRFDYTINNTVNASLQDASPTSFTAGGHEFLQNTTNFDVSKYFNSVAHGLNLAFGAEFRVDGYKIRAGEEASWKNYGLVTQPDGTVVDELGLSGGSQSFPGFSPYNAGSHSRNNISVYTDAELNVTKNWMMQGAIRFENYSDFGSTINGKFATRYEVSNAFALRGAVSTGFRAPSLQQQFFSYVSTDLVNGKIANSGFFPVTSDVAKFIGIPELKEETSVNASAGFTLRPAKRLSITVDGYYIKINNRITLTGNFGQDPYGDTDPVIQEYLLPYNASTARFFVNSVDTKTIGLDFVATYTANLSKNNFLDFTLVGNLNKNEVTHVNDIPEKLSSQPDIYFSPAERSLIEGINPRAKGNFTITYRTQKFTALLRNQYFGKVTRDGFPFGEVQVHKGKVVTDLAFSYDFTKTFSVSLGANNLLDVFPDEQVYSNSYFGVFKYAPVQMGTTGAFYFVKALIRIANK
ncbi:MAG TPA: TonB-dependent receptor, partial [Chitinophagaceae bacterium]|nr:TonB-dependent receptor [Chitinophagaceae bacterium]